MKPYSRAYNRDVSIRKALRKKRISDQVYYSSLGITYYNNLHQYSKNKIHCSCGRCRNKTNNKGKHRRIYANYAPSKNYSWHDLKRIEAMNDDLFENFKNL